jgi:hypothetical protein
LLRIAPTFPVYPPFVARRHVRSSTRCAIRPGRLPATGDLPRTSVMSGTGFDSIHNYYERLVFDEVLRVASLRSKPIDPRLLPDIACVALNRLPPRYIRHEVDFSFYLTDEEREDQRRRVGDAVAQAFSYVTSGLARATTA